MLVFRRLLFTDESLLPHELGQGQAAFRRHKRSLEITQNKHHLLVSLVPRPPDQLHDQSALQAAGQEPGNKVLSVARTLNFLCHVLQPVCPVRLVILVNATPHCLPQSQLIHETTIRPEEQPNIQAHKKEPHHNVTKDQPRYSRPSLRPVLDYKQSKTGGGEGLGILQMIKNLLTILDTDTV